MVEAGEPAPLRLRRGEPETRGMRHFDLVWQRPGGRGLSPGRLAWRALAAAEHNPVELCEQSGILVRVPKDAGRFVINQLLWEDQTYDAAKARRFASLLFTNLGVMMTARSLVPVAEKGWFFANLAPLCNGRLKTDHGNDLRNLPTGVSDFRGIPFRVIPHGENEGMGLVQLRSVLELEDGTVVAGRAGLPESVTVPVRRRAGRLAFLHIAGFNHSLKRYAKPRVCEYVVTYRGGAREVLAVRDGQEVRNWWTYEPQDLPNAKVAWHGANPSTRSVAVYLLAWSNPFPGRAIESVTVRSCANPPWDPPASPSAARTPSDGGRGAGVGVRGSGELGPGRPKSEV